MSPRAGSFHLAISLIRNRDGNVSYRDTVVYAKSGFYFRTIPPRPSRTRIKTKSPPWPPPVFCPKRPTEKRTLLLCRSFYAVVSGFDDPAFEYRRARRSSRDNGRPNVVHGKHAARAQFAFRNENVRVSRRPGRTRISQGTTPPTYLIIAWRYSKCAVAHESCMSSVWATSTENTNSVPITEAGRPTSFGTRFPRRRRVKWFSGSTILSHQPSRRGRSRHLSQTVGYAGTSRRTKSKRQLPGVPLKPKPGINPENRKITNLQSVATKALCFRPKCRFPIF